MKPRGHFPRKKPAKPAKGQGLTPQRTVELVIESVGARGDGMARIGPDPIFVPHTIAGERVLARVEGRRGDGLVGALVEVIEPAPNRVDPPCPHFAVCGGCALQHLSLDAYGAWKRDLLATQLGRHGLGDADLAPLVSVPPGRRRRASFAFVRRGAKVALGFNARASHVIVEVEQCPLVEPPLVALLPGLRGVLAAVVADGKGGDVIVNLTSGGLDVLVEAEAALDLFDREKLAAFAEEADLARLSWRRPGTGFIDPVARRRPAVISFAGIEVEPPPGSFLQPTGEGERAIAGLVVEAMGPAKIVADLYSGCGSLSVPLAVTGRAVHAVEGEEAPVLSLQAAARRSGLKLTTEARDLARRPLLGPELKRFDAVVFDPPRAGAASQCEVLAEFGPPLLVAVSCNPATLGRDLRILVDGGYRLETVTPIDQFPWSPHLEAVAVLRR